MPKFRRALHFPWAIEKLIVGSKLKIKQLQLIVLLKLLTAPYVNHYVLLNFLINMFKVNNEDCETTSSDFTEVPFIVQFEHIQHSFQHLTLLFYCWLWSSICLIGLRNVGKFLGKHLYRSLFDNKVVGWVCNFIKK